VGVSVCVNVCVHEYECVCGGRGEGVGECDLLLLVHRASPCHSTSAPRCLPPPLREPWSEVAQGHHLVIVSHPVPGPRAP
jgi:hypothetical protein